jgi:hypothetical protein
MSDTPPVSVDIPGKRGPKGKLTPELKDKIVKAVRAGNYIETAAAWAGIHKDTFYDWFHKGQASRAGLYREFADELEIAWAESEVRDLQTISMAAAENWAAAAWRLERKFPTRWGRKDRMELSGTDGNPIETRTSVVSEDAQALADLLARIATRLAPEVPGGTDGAGETPE